MAEPWRWGPIDLAAGDSFERTLGDLTLRCRRSDLELWLQEERLETPGEEDWVRWATPPDTRFELRPGLPDRSIVVATEQPYRLPPKARSLIFVRVPLFVRVVHVASGREDLVHEATSVVLSDTWWGAFTEGELAYWVETRARRSIREADFLPHLAICPFQLINESTVPLRVDRFLVRLEHLSLFQGDAGIWTDEVKVRYVNSEEGSEIDHTGGVPTAAGTVELLVPPRVPPPRGLRGRTFSRLRALAGGGDGR